MVNAQQWLNSKFPNQDAKRKIKQLYIYATNGTDNNNNGNCYFYNVQLEGELNLEEFSNLEYIQIQGNSSNLNNYQKLTSLRIANCRKLRTFYLYYNNSQFTMDGSKALTTLYLQYCQNLTNLQLSEQLSKLTNLQIQYCSNLTTINGLDNLITLNSLNLNNCGQLTTLNGLDGLYRLTNFTMVGGSVTSLENFNNSTNLNTLTIQNCYSLTKGPNLSNLPKLTNLTIVNAPFSPNWQEKAMLLSELDKLTNPNISQEITKLRERVRNLKIEHLPPKLANQKSELQQLINQSKNKLGELQSLLDIFLDNQIEVVQNPENDFVRKQTGKLKGFLRTKLTDAEIKNLQDKQTEIIQLQEQLTSWQDQQLEAKVEIPLRPY